MTPEKILSYPSLKLTQKQREHYFEYGYVSVEDICYNSADAKPYTPHPDPSSHAYSIVRGNPVRWADHDPRPCLIPPDWTDGYTSIFAAQAGESS